MNLVVDVVFIWEILASRYTLISPQSSNEKKNKNIKKTLLNYKKEKKKHDKKVVKVRSAAQHDPRFPCFHQSSSTRNIQNWCSRHVNFVESRLWVRPLCTTCSNIIFFVEMMREVYDERGKDVVSFLVFVFVVFWLSMFESWEVKKGSRMTMRICIDMFHVVFLSIS